MIKIFVIPLDTTKGNPASKFLSLEVNTVTTIIRPGTMGIILVLFCTSVQVTGRLLDYIFTATGWRGLAKQSVQELRNAD